MDEIFKFWLMILFWITLIQWIVTYFMLHRFELVDKLWKEFSKKYYLMDVNYNNWNYYYYYFTWAYEVTKKDFNTDSINYYDKIVFWTSWCNLNNSLKQYINAWNNLDVNWMINDVGALKEFYSKTDLKWLFNKYLPKEQEISICD